MKKIFLIDDNQDGKRSKYGSAFVDEGRYADLLCPITRISVADDLSFISDAACVLLHETLNDYYDGRFHDDSQKVAAQIEQFPGLGDNIPFVKFSDNYTSDLGDYDSNTPNELFRLSKRAFYNRLESFVVHYRDTGKIDLRILAYGEDFVKILLEKAATTVFGLLHDIDDKDILDAPTIACPEMKQIVELSQPALGKNYIEIINDLQMHEISVGEFKNRINNILDNFQDYGKNYYSWK